MKPKSSCTWGFAADGSMAPFPWSSLSSALSPSLPSASASAWRQDSWSSWPHIQNSHVQTLVPPQSLNNKDLPQRLPENHSFCLVGSNCHSFWTNPGKRLWLPLVTEALPWVSGGGELHLDQLPLRHTGFLVNWGRPDRAQSPDRQEEIGTDAGEAKGNIPLLCQKPF